MNAHVAQSTDCPSLIHPTPNEYVGRHRSVQSELRYYGAAPVVPAGIALSLGVEPHLMLNDATGATVRILLSPEDVEHIVAQANEHTRQRETRYARSAS